MNLTKLFEIQKQLDERIVTEHNLQGQDLLPKKILALQVELGELANEWKGFKFWSNNQEPNTSFIEPIKNIGQIGNRHLTYGKHKNPLLEEYVDCLHFILSIGLEFDCKDLVIKDFYHRENDTTKQFKYVFYTVSSLDERIVCKDELESIHEMYAWLFGGFIILGEMLGFTWEQIETAYLEKNKENHSRQDRGY